MVSRSINLVCLGHEIKLFVIVDLFVEVERKGFLFPINIFLIWVLVLLKLFSKKSIVFFIKRFIYLYLWIDLEIL